MYLYKYPGIIKSNIDHSSESEFSIGVPVNANFVSALINFTAFEFLVLLFFMYCASSATIYLKLYCVYKSMSLFKESYDVIIT